MSSVIDNVISHTREIEATILLVICSLENQITTSRNFHFICTEKAYIDKLAYRVYSSGCGEEEEEASGETNKVLSHLLCFND
jgi:hypothetical protein